MAELRNTFVSDARFEHSFWLSVLRDHTEFIRQSLGPTEQETIVVANHLHQEALLLIEQFEHIKSVEEMRTFSLRMVDYTTRLLHFKQMLLDRQLVCKITLHLVPSLLDHMFREGQEYLQVIAQLLHGQYLEGPALAIHEANLWLADGAVHAALIRSNVDPQEQDIFESAHKWKTEFNHLYVHLQELQTKLRTNVRWTPSLERLVQMSKQNMTLFRQYLLHMEELVTECKVLGNLKPLFFDHMAREAAYFLEKLERSQK